MSRRPKVASTPSVRVAGSFRDPSGYVFTSEARLFRTLDDGAWDTISRLREDGLLAELIDAGMVVDTWPVQDPGLLETFSEEHGPYRHFLEHRLIEPVTYPYEWSVSMVADAGILTLDLQCRLLERGYSLKDATAFNVQFVNARPVFIDLLSVERPDRLDVWPALGQFGPMFTYPLMLTLYHGWDLRSCFIPHLGGLDVARVARAIGRMGRLRPRSWLDITLPYLLGKRKVGAQLDSNEFLSRKRDSDPRAQIINLKRIRKKLEGMSRRYKPSGVWATYTDNCTYESDSDKAKKSLVAEFLDTTGPSVVLDLGCNTGSYSELACRAGCRVIAVDSDHDAIEILYRRLRDRRADITPMVVDLGNPSPGIGYLNAERSPFLERIEADCVLALALVHHLLVTGNLSVDAVREQLSALTRDALIVEFVPIEDPMFKELLKRRVGPFDAVTRDRFVESFRQRFEVTREDDIPGTDRVLFLMRKRD